MSKQSTLQLRLSHLYKYNFIRTFN